MKLVNDLLIIFTVAIPLIFILLAVFLGFKRNIYQSLAKLGMTIFAIFISVLIAKLVAPAIARPTFMQLMEISNNVSTELVNSIAQLLSVLIVPIVFVVVFSLVSLVCLILYITISKKKLTDAEVVKLKNRKASTTQKNTETKEIAEQSDAQPVTDEAPTADNTKAKKAWIRVSCVALSVFSVILVLSHFSVPLSYYSAFADDTLSTPFIQEEIGDDILPVSKLVSNYPSVQCYRVVSTPATWCFDRITTPGGEGDSAKNTINTLIRIVDSITNLDTAPKREDFFAVSAMIKDSSYLDCLLLQTAENLIDAWSRGEDLFGLKPDVLGGNLPLNALKQSIKNVRSAEELFYILGDFISLSDILDGGVTPEALTEVFVDFQINSVAFLEQIALDGIKDLDKFSVDVSEDLVSSVFAKILEIKADTSIPNDEKNKILATEAESLSVFMSLIENPKKADATQVGSSIAKSKAFSDAIISATKGGTVKDPCGFGKTLSTGFAKKVKSAMELEGISKDSELYKSTDAFFGK
ncbi:MAG: hypothetical protein J6Q92_04130 [Oscillospiraceae bacterium]|nr:hypothetical protein [Oscillospiraceae bacterium]